MTERPAFDEANHATKKPNQANVPQSDTRTLVFFIWIQYKGVGVQFSSEWQGSSAVPETRSKAKKLIYASLFELAGMSHRRPAGTANWLA